MKQNTIYLLAMSHHLEDTLEGFATNEADIRQIIENHYKESYMDELSNVCVDLEGMKVTATDSDDDKREYIIHKIERVKCRE